MGYGKTGCGRRKPAISLSETVEDIGGDSIEARRRVPPHFLEPEARKARNGACLLVFWNKNILNTHYYG